MWYIILGLLSLMYLLINLVLPSILGGFLGAYIVRPLLWVLMALTVFLIAKKDELNIYNFKKIRRWEIGKDPFQAALLIGGFQVSLLVIAGLFFGFGESPYAFTPFAILTNIFFVMSALVGIELARAYLVKKWASTRRNITLVIGLIALIFMLIAISPSDFAVLTFSDPAAAIKFIGETMIPLFAMSLFASYLAYLGGAIAAIGYMGILQAFQWFSPALPDLDWAVAALIGTLAPAVGFVIIQNSIQLMQKTPSGGRKRRKKKDPAVGWTAVAAVCVLLIFFSTGFLGIQPTIIYSGSMRDSIDVGDIVIITEVPVDEIHEGDIIQFKNGNASIPIIHRVYDIYENEDNKVFVTKGDANDEPDREPVMPAQIMGKAIFNIPKVGWIPIAIKSIVNKFGFRI